jgi:hypothetical protein
MDKVQQYENDTWAFSLSFYFILFHLIRPVQYVQLILDPPNLDMRLAFMIQKTLKSMRLIMMVPICWRTNFTYIYNHFVR